MGTGEEVMSKELDRKIAELVMNDPKPDGKPTWLQETTEAWQVVSWVWEPKSFSTDLDQTMRAVNAFLDKAQYGNMKLLYNRADTRKWIVLLSLERSTPTMPEFYKYSDEVSDEVSYDALPEAICELLVALVESNSG